ncbi:MAG: hypothetical protein ACE5JD_09810 [Candidatus Methylomirabilia bacterium]
MRRKRRNRSPSPPARRTVPLNPSAIEQRGLGLVKELTRVVRGADPPREKLGEALEILFAAFSESEEPFRQLLIEGWVRARQQKAYRLAMAWLREQMRLSVEEILAEGIARGTFRHDLDPQAYSAVCLGAAEGCLLDSRSQGGAVPPDQLVTTLLGLAARNS